jgi:hypothetical protein
MGAFLNFEFGHLTGCVNHLGTNHEYITLIILDKRDIGKEMGQL